MKKIRLSSIAFMLMASMFYAGCQSDVELPNPQSSILPDRFGIDIPDGLSNDNATPNGRVAEIDSLSGNEIYHYLSFFINVGEEGANIVGDIIHGIKKYDINHPMSLSYESDDDGRTKNLVVKENPSFDGRDYEFVLTITDAESEGEADGGKGLQIFWNRYPIKGIAIIKPYNLDRNSNFECGKDAMVSIEYSEAGDHGYEQHMIVSIGNIDTGMEEPDDIYMLSAMKMFVGKNDDVIDIYGNSDHPYARFLTEKTGYNWAFVASGSQRLDIGVAEVGLPPSVLDEPSREILLGYYSLKNVFEREILAVWPNIERETLNAILHNMEAPAYFDADGFVSGGTSPGEVYDILAERLDILSPYNPKEIRNLTISFQ